jgi:hypothetical protein
MSVPSSDFVRINPKKIRSGHEAGTKKVRKNCLAFHLNFPVQLFPFKHACGRQGKAGESNTKQKRTGLYDHAATLSL